MMQVIPKWKVTIPREHNTLVFYISDHFLSNVLRKVADIELEVQAEQITIALVPNGTVTSGSMVTSVR